jgi:hypothetical protein
MHWMTCRAISGGSYREVLARVPASNVQGVHVARHQVPHVPGSLQSHERHVREAGPRAVKLARCLEAVAQVEFESKF